MSDTTKKPKPDWPIITEQYANYFENKDGKSCLLAFCPKCKDLESWEHRIKEAHAKFVKSDS